MSLTDRHNPYLAPASEIERRIAGLRSAMRADGLALVWIDHLADRLYFTGSAQDGILLVPGRDDPVFFVRKSLGRAERESRVPVKPYPGGKAMLSRVRERVAADGRVGLAMDVTPASAYLRLGQSLADCALVDVAGAVRALRAVKSAWEVDQIRRASDQVTDLFGEIAEHVRPGMLELELTGRVEGRLRALGHGGTVRVRRPAADIAIGVVVSGPSALYPTNFNGPVGGEGPYPGTASGAGWKRLAAGETVMLDLVTSHNGYHADTTRTFFLGGRAPNRVRRAHELCLEVLARIEERLRPGSVCSDVYRDVESFVKKRGAPEGFMGFGENRVRFFGHGVGLELDELPVLAEKIDTALEPGHVLAVEPKAFLQGIGPVGVESTYVVTEGGCESLCPVENDLHLLGG